LLDIDHFKIINDTHGHAVGDEVLQAVARVLAQQVRGYDVVCRWGGEEFLALLPKTSLAEAEAVAERIRAAIEAQTLTVKDNLAVRLTASLGLTTLIRTLSFHELTHYADVALYAAKQSGRNRVCVQVPAPPLVE
jgi:diguanylate cyclase (GGDEF)-like protein